MLPQLEQRSTRILRRRFLATLSAFWVGSTSAPWISLGGEVAKGLNVAVVGAGGKGTSDTDAVARLGENIVGLCDVDQSSLLGQARKYPKAKVFRDFRKMLELMEGSIDAVIVSTPDHIHAPAAISAMSLGKHVYVQKPLAHSISEVRAMRDLARDKAVATQMGNQGSSEPGLWRAAEVVQAGLLGPVRQIHAWTDRPSWPQGVRRPGGQDAVPPGLDWDLWLGPAPLRAYKSGAYHPFRWRGWQDFGTGALGDMGCHILNMPVRALNLSPPHTVQAEAVSGANPETYPAAARVRFDFAARGDLPEAKLWWYEGGLNPPLSATGTVLETMGRLSRGGSLLIGDKGILYSPNDYGGEFYLRLAGDRGFSHPSIHEAVRAVPITSQRSPGHYREWTDACRGGAPALSAFDTASILAEIVLTGCVAARIPKRLVWDSRNLKFVNAPEATPLILREYRRGWEPRV